MTTLQQRFVLTAAEIRIVVFVFSALALGLVAKHYRVTREIAAPNNISSVDAEAGGTTKTRSAPRRSKPAKAPVALERNANSSATEPSDD